MFSLSRKEQEKAEEFIAEMRKKVIEENKKRREENPPVPGSHEARMAEMEEETGIPYSGAIGGSVTYCFTPTSLGTIVKVCCWGEERDVTDFDDW